MIRPVLLLALSFALAGCDKQEVTPTPGHVAPRGDVELALIVGRALEAHATAVDSVLAAHSLTRAGFDSLLYRIASDPAMSAAYAAGRSNGRR